MTVTLTNGEIYNYANALAKEFNNSELKLPIRINFYLQKNMAELIGLAQDVDKERISIVEEFGTYNEKTQSYDIPKDKVIQAGNKLDELFSLTQEVKLYKVKLDDFNDIELTAAQMQALLFMIDEEE